jgi:lysophospholipase L1-like esterase
LKKALLISTAIAIPIVVIGAILFRRKKINPKGMLIAFIGDSYTAGYGWGWQSVLAKTYGFTEKNLAVGGKRTDWMLSQVRSYLDTSKPNIMMIYGGANDAYSLVSNETALNNIQAIVDLCNSKGVKPIVIAGYNAKKVQVGNPNAKTTIYVRTQEEMWKYGEKYYELELMIEKKIKDAIVVPIWDGASQSDAPDGLHLTANAQSRFAQYVGEYLFKQ